MSEQKSLEQIGADVLAECRDLRAQRDAALAALSSGKCSEHQTPDPLNCDACNAVKWHSKADEHRMVQAAQLRAELDRLTAELAEARGDKERLLHALNVVLPMARGYAVEHNVGKNNQIVSWAELIAGSYAIDAARNK
jgi:exonuclease VII large subunit